MNTRTAPLAALCSALVLAGALAAPAALFAEQPSATQVASEARAALAAKEPQKAADALRTFLMRSVATGEIEDLYGQALLLLGRKDEAAHHFGAALRLLPETEPSRKLVLANISKADPLYTRRTGLMNTSAKALLASAQKLKDGGHTERALELLERIEPIASGAELQTITALAAQIRAASETVDLAKGASDEAEGGERPQVQVEGQHYYVDANLEQAVAENVRDVMDDVYNYYVQVYFDGDVERVSGAKPTIRIHPTHAKMVEHWDGPKSVGGWWSPSEQTVVCYDTRTDSGSLDPMLETLYHEASHHFMTMLSQGGHVPAWINEGTASFFEGATAMADRRVLWPDAAEGRLRALEYQLRTGTGPTAAKTISYDEPGSYPGEYYSFGWGLVYYLLQYEDPETLEYVFRPLYSEYREKIAKSGADPMKLFEEIFLGPRAPGKFTEFAPWAKQWSTWIRESVYPLHFSAPDRIRELRLERIHAYVAAADKAKKEKAAPVPEVELLSRALGHLEYIIKKLDKTPDVELMLLQADVLERMGRPQSTAALIEEVLDLVDKEKATLEPARIDALEKRQLKLDTKNQALRAAKNAARGFSRTALKLVADYRASAVPMKLTAYQVARSMAVALDHEPLAQLADELRVQAREAGLLIGALYDIDGRVSDWATIFERPDEEFSVEPDRIKISCARPIGRIYTPVSLSGEYEVRCTLERGGNATRMTTHGVVFAGTPDGMWFMAGIDGKGQVVVRRYAKGGTETPRGLIKADQLKPPIAKDENPTFAVRVSSSKEIQIKVGDREPIALALEEELPTTANIGVFAKNGETIVRGLVVEVFP